MTKKLLIYKSALIAMMFTVLNFNVSFAQSKVWNNKINNELQTQEATVLDLFTISTEGGDAVLDAVIDNIVYLKLNKEVFEQAKANKHKLIQFSVPVAALSNPIVVMQQDIYADNFRIYTKGENGRRTDITHLVDKGVHYGGIVSGEVVSYAAVSFTSTFFNAIISTPADGNFNLSLNTLNPGENYENYVLYRERDIKNAAEIAPYCAADDLEYNNLNPVSYKGKPSVGSYPSCKILKVSLHSDYQVYTTNSNDTNKVIQYLQTMFNGNKTLFLGEEIESAISEIVVGTVPDGYDVHTNSDGILNQYGNELKNTGFEGDISQIVTGGNHGHGGLAWLDVLCRTPSPQGSTYVGPWSMVNNNADALPPSFPTYSWDVSASTHEMGHNIGSPHTHSCSWPNVAIDGCVPPQGSCAQGPLPPPNGGTIMSYCHLNPQVGIGFNNYFGPLPGQLIRDKINEASCMVGAIPQKTLTLSSTLISANRECQDGDWMHYYNDNNTLSDDSDDILLLSINANGEDLGSINGGTTITMKTTAGYDLSPRNVTAPYAADPLWREINRTWTVSINQPSAAATVRFPFDSIDVKDMKFEYPTVQPNQLIVYYFTNQNAASNPNNAGYLDIKFATNGSSASTSKWKLGTNGNHFYAEMKMDKIYGGSMGYAPNFNSINNLNHIQNINVYPNPATETLVIDLNESSLAANTISVQISDQIGRVILTKELQSNTGKAKINIAALSAGLYTIKVTNDKNIAIAKFAKQ